MHTLSRTDALYFTITVSSSVGFGDITATSQTARVLVMVQMILDLVVIGLVVRPFVGAVKHARQQDPIGSGSLSQLSASERRLEGHVQNAQRRCQRPATP